MKTAIFLANGSEIRVEPENGKNFTLTEMQSIVGGYIQIIPCDDIDYICVMNEEGKLTEHQANVKATVLCWNTLGCGADYIAGDVLICKPSQVE